MRKIMVTHVEEKSSFQDCARQTFRFLARRGVVGILLVLIPRATLGEQSISLKMPSESAPIDLNSYLSQVSVQLENSKPEDIAGYRPSGFESISLSWQGHPRPTAKSYVVPSKGKNFQLCETLAVGGESLSFDPTRVECPSGQMFFRELLLVIEFPQSEQSPAEYLILLWRNRKAPFVGTDMGFGITLDDRWNDKDSFGLQEGVNGYYSLSKLKNDHWRVIASLGLLDHDPTKDFELGLGAGLAFRTFGWSRESSNGFAFAFGVGKNLMLLSGENPWYTFIGLNYNITSQE